MENSSQVNTRAILLVLENIKSNVEHDDNLPSKNKVNGVDAKRKGELINSGPKSIAPTA